MKKQGCGICGGELVYEIVASEKQCSLCKNSVLSAVQCENGHFICDTCHGQESNDFIEAMCKETKITNPFQLISLLMSHDSVKMHGPEHHFLVPAVLATCYLNVTGQNALLAENLTIIRERSKNILGGFCGFYGCCGAAMGVGVFFSVIQNCTPLSTKEWGLSNLATARVLESIGKLGGPRCCKRNSFAAINEAILFLETHFSVRLEKTSMPCDYSSINSTCKKALCPFYHKVL